MNTEQKIEAVLFWKGEPMSRKKLSEVLKVELVEINEAVLKLKESLQNRGVALIEKGDPARNAFNIADAGGEVMLGTAPEMSELIESLQKEELNKDLSKAALETLSIVLYKNGASRSEIDYIRGVNSSFTLRALSVRGLVEKTTDAKDSRKFIYKPTFELLSFMGVKSVEELPEYGSVNKEIEGIAEEDGKDSEQ